MIAALFVETGGCYYGLDGVDPWDQERDARKYDGPHVVIAHPPCQRWGRYWSGGPSAKVRRELGDDDGCFESALHSVCKWGGVLEHPEASHAWKRFGIRTPLKGGGWDHAFGILGGHVPQECNFDAWTCCVEQGHYGHPARKATWLLFCGDRWSLPALKWGRSAGQRLDEGFHSKAERDAARAAGILPRKRLSKAQNLATPIPFRDLLLSIARSAAGNRKAA